MPVAQVGDIFELVARGICFNQEIQLTHHYRLIVVPADTEVSTITTFIINEARGGAGGNDQLEGEYLDLLPADYLLTQWSGQMVYPNRYAKKFQTRDVAGTNAGATETANQSCVITLQSDYSGRDQVSNKHIGPLPQTAGVQVNGLISAGYKALMFALRVQLSMRFENIGGTIQLDPVIYHRTGVGGHFDNITDGYEQTTVRTMRRRTVGVGV